MKALSFSRVCSFHLYIFLLKIYEDLQTLRIKEDLIAQESSFVLEALDIGLTLASSM